MAMTSHRRKDDSGYGMVKRKGCGSIVLVVAALLLLLLLVLAVRV